MIDNIFRILLLIILLCLHKYNAKAQKDVFFDLQGDTVKCQILSSDEKDPVPFAHIINQSSKRATISDSTGRFVILAGVMDTLLITAIGYIDKQIIIHPDFSEKSTKNILLLHEKYYALGEVTIHALGSWEEFKQKFMDLDLPETKTERLQTKLKEEGDQVARRNTPINAGFPLNFRSKEAKQRAELKRILEEERRQKIIDQKYNKEIIARLTGLKEPQLTEFMVFCGFSKAFLYNASQYDIFYLILKNYRIYKYMLRNEKQDPHSN